MTEFQFHRKRKKEIKEKVYECQGWIKVLSRDNKSSWSFICIDDKKDFSFVSGSNNTTKCKDRLYMICFIEFLEWISTDKKLNINIHTDNKYLVNVIEDWIDKWSKNDFKKSQSESEIEAFKKSQSESEIRAFKKSQSESEIRAFKKSQSESEIENAITQEKEDELDRPNADLLRKLYKLKTQNISIFMRCFYTDNEFTRKAESLCCNELNLP